MLVFSKPFPGRATLVEQPLPTGAAVPVGELVDTDTHLALVDEVTGDVDPAGFDEGQCDKSRGLLPLAAVTCW